jgi:hypothetical protein
MAARACQDLDRAILNTLGDAADGSSEWLRFLAVREARRLGMTAVDAESSLRRLHDRGCLALAFGLERGTLTDVGVLVARRIGRRFGGFAMTVGRRLPRAHARAS